MSVLVPTLPLHLLTTTGGAESAASSYKFRPVVTGDLRRAAALTRRASTWDERCLFETDRAGRPVTMYPTPQEVVDFCAGLHFLVSVGKVPIVAADVETSGEHQLQCKLLCLGLAYNDGRRDRVLNVPFLARHGQPYWANAHDEEMVRAALRGVLGDVRITKLFHNGAFDTVVLWAHGFLVNGWRADSMAAHHCVDSELPHNLGFVASRWLESRFWKDDVKGKEAWLDMDPNVLRLYNLRDTLSTLRVYPHLVLEMMELGVERVYETEMRLSQIMARATIRGMAVDFERRDSRAIDIKTGKPVGLGPQLELQRDQALAALREVGGAAFDPQKPTELRWLLFQKLKLPVVKETKSGLPSTDREALMLLDMIADSAEQKKVLLDVARFRQGTKFLSTFVEGLEVLADGRFHPSWKSLTVTGRLNSSPNFQNLSKRIKRIFRAALGFKLVGVDLSQAELRGTAYLANEPTLLEMYRLGIDVHTVNASMLFRLRGPPLDADATEAKRATLAATEAYLREACVKYLGLPPGAYDAFPVCPASKWGSSRTLIKNHEFGKIYGAECETVHGILRSKRDPETLALLFPGIALSEIEALDVIWRTKLRAGIVSYWGKIQTAIRRNGMARCPLSGRIRRFRDGFKRNEMLNWNTQTLVASWMNESTLLIQERFDKDTGGQALVNQQVHDALTVEAPDDYAKEAGRIMVEILGRPFDIIPPPGFESAIGRHHGARLPADPATIADYLDKSS